MRSNFRELCPTKEFAETFNRLEDTTRKKLKEKLDIALQNPFHFKSLTWPGMRLFRIRFSENKQEKRLIYVLEGEKLILVCILDRKKGYKELKKHFSA